MLLSNERIKEENIKRTLEIAEAASKDNEKVDRISCMLDFREGAYYSRSLYEERVVKALSLLNRLSANQSLDEEALNLVEKMKLCFKA